MIICNLSLINCKLEVINGIFTVSMNNSSNFSGILYSIFKHKFYNFNFPTRSKIIKFKMSNNTDLCSTLSYYKNYHIIKKSITKELTTEEINKLINTKCLLNNDINIKSLIRDFKINVFLNTL